MSNNDKYSELHQRLAEQFYTSESIIKAIRSYMGEGKTREQLIHMLEKKIASSRHYKNRDKYINPLVHSRKHPKRYYLGLLQIVNKLTPEQIAEINVPLEENV